MPGGADYAALDLPVLTAHAMLIDDRGTTVEELRAPADGIVVMARRTARVQAGDGAYLLAHQEDSTR